MILTTMLFKFSRKAAVVQANGMDKSGDKFTEE